jgi:hypothetical protein
VLGGMGHPSGVRSVASRSGALRNFGLKPRMPRLLRGKQDEKSTSIRMRKCRRMRDEGRA